MLLCMCARAYVCVWGGGGGGGEGVVRGGGRGGGHGVCKAGFVILKVSQYAGYYV